MRTSFCQRKRRDFTFNAFYLDFNGNVYDYFDGIFKNAGDIGYRCEDEKEFIETIKRLDETPDTKRYSEQVANLKQLQNKFAIENVEMQLNDIIQSVMNSKTL